MELNVRIAIPQLVDNKQVYEEIPRFSFFYLSHPIKMTISFITL
jgi:hypothetical protein